MKLVLLFALLAVATAHWSRGCDLSNGHTAAENPYYLSTIGFWQHDVTVITPDPYNPPQRNVQTYSTWQLNYNNVERCAVSAIEFNPRITENGEFALAIQEIDAKLLKPCYAKCRVPDLFSSSSSSDDDSSSSSHGRKRFGRQKCEQSRPFTWVTPPTADSLFVQNAIPHNTILADTLQATAWQDKDTDTIVLFETLYTVVPNQHRLYTLSIPAEFVPGNPLSTDIAALVTFNSNVIPMPPFVAAALQAYQAGQVPLATDPNSPPGFPVQVYLFVVPQAKRGEDMNLFRESAETLERIAHETA